MQEHSINDFDYANGKTAENMETKYARTIIDFSMITLLAIIVFRNWIFTSE